MNYGLATLVLAVLIVLCIVGIVRDIVNCIRRGEPWPF